MKRPFNATDATWQDIVAEADKIGLKPDAYLIALHYGAKDWNSDPSLLINVLKDSEPANTLI